MVTGSRVAMSVASGADEDPGKWQCRPGAVGAVGAGVGSVKALQR